MKIDRWPKLRRGTRLIFSRFAPATPTIPPVVKPVFVVQPSITGSTVLGSTVTVNFGTVDGTPVPSLTGVLTRPGKSAVTVLDGDTFQIEASDQGGAIMLDVTATNIASSVMASVTLAVPFPTWSTEPTDGGILVAFSASPLPFTATPADGGILIGY